MLNKMTPFKVQNFVCKLVNACKLDYYVGGINTLNFSDRKNGKNLDDAADDSAISLVLCPSECTLSGNFNFKYKLLVFCFCFLVPFSVFLLLLSLTPFVSVFFFLLIQHQYKRNFLTMANC